LPMLGLVRAADLSQQQLESALAKSFKSLTGHDAVVSILSVERPGVYVLGPVKAPGSYHYVPGMTVLHAIALAGGLETGGDASWERVQAVQELGKRRDAIDDLPALMARIAVLQAERDGNVVQPPRSLLDLVGDAGAKQLIAKEVQRRAAVDATRRDEKRALADSLQNAKQQVQTASQSLGAMNTLIKIRGQRADGVRSLAANGYVNNQYLLQAQGDLADAEQRRQDAEAKYAEAQQRVTQVEEEQAKLEADEKSSLDSSISAIEQQITAGQREIAESNRVLGALNVSGREPRYVQASATPGGGSPFEIVRRTPNGPVSLPANEMTALRPGDLVKIPADTRPALDRDERFTQTQPLSQPGDTPGVLAAR
jgi:polysaccharide biosynthesis/export protein ExoF